MTFGEYFHKLLTDRQTNLTKLAEGAGIKSKTTIYRMFEDKYSYEKVHELTEKMLPILKLTKDEEYKLYSLMEDCKIKSNVKKAWGILEKLYQHTEYITDKNMQKIHEKLKENQKSEINIFIGSEVDENIALFLNKFLLDNEGYNISVTHLLNFNRSEDIIASELFSAIKLMPREEYQCFEMSKTELKDLIILIHMSIGYHLVMLTSSNEYIESSVSKELYEHLLKKCNICKKGTALKDTRDHLTDYLYTIEKFSVMETNNAFSLNESISFSDIPFDIMCRLLKDANYFGMTPNTPFIKNLVCAAEERYKLKLKSDLTRLYILPLEQVEKFISTGKTMDHVEGLRALTKEEITTVINSFINGRHRFKYRFPKEEYSKNCIECVLIEDYGIVLIDAALGYGKKHFQTVISHPKAMNVFKSFIEHFWDKNTVSDEESRQKMNRLINKYLK